MSNDKVSFLAFSCTHAPLHDNAAVDWALGVAEDTQPDYVIHLGDFLEADAASKFPSKYEWTLKDEFIAANKHLKAFREVTPDARHIVLEGNHDWNVLDINRLDSRLARLVDWHEGIEEIRHGHWETPCTYTNDRRLGVFRLGQVGFSHGFRAGETADNLSCERFADPYGLLVCGHTHRPKPVTKYRPAATRTPPYWAPYWANTGTLRDIDNVDYMKKCDRSGWGQAVVVGETPLWRYSENSIISSKQWEAETLIYRMFEE